MTCSGLRAFGRDGTCRPAARCTRVDRGQQLDVDGLEDLGLRVLQVLFFEVRAAEDGLELAADVLDGQQREGHEHYSLLGSGILP